MAAKGPNDPSALLQRVLDADKVLRNAEEAFFTAAEPKALTVAIGGSIEKLFDDPTDDAISSLLRLSNLLSAIEGAESTKLLVRLLGHGEPALRADAGEALVDRGWDRYAEVARAFEAEADKGENVLALCEMPFLLAELGEPGGVKICRKLLAHAEADVVGAAIEGLAQLGDPAVIPDIEKLLKDKRTVSSDEDEPEAEEVSIGDLAADALSVLKEAPGADSA